MNRYLKSVLVLVSVLGLSGCVVRTYPIVKDRVDQDLMAGNKGYIMGKAPANTESKERNATRTTRVVEVELGSPIKFEKRAKAPEMKPVEQEEETSNYGNRGYITQKEVKPAISEGEFQKYTVEKNDTLQKISKKLYGTTKKWYKIYQANKATMSAPDKIYPGQVINVPVYGGKAEKAESNQENLK